MVLRKLFKSGVKIENIKCPQCFEEQEVSAGTVSIYCKNCRARLDINSIKNSSQEKPKTQQWRPKTKTVSCPVCHSMQEVLSSAISAYCKNCHHRIPIKETKNSEFKETPKHLEQRPINCPHCGSTQNVPTTALSSFCSDCGNRVNLQNYQIRGRFRGELDTKGSVFIASDGDVEGNINTGSLVIAGGFKGEVIADQKVELKSTGKLFGKIISPALVVSSGAVMVGHSHIGNNK